jgi:hypothetical protein
VQFLFCGENSHSSGFGAVGIADKGDGAGEAGADGNQYRLDHLYDYLMASLGPSLFAHHRGKLLPVNRRLTGY